MSLTTEESTNDDDPAEFSKCKSSKDYCPKSSLNASIDKELTYEQRFPINSFLSEKVVCRRSKTHGAGLFAIDTIQQGETIIIFTGKVIRKERLAELNEEQLMHVLQIQEDFFQIPFIASGNNEQADFINHCCEPNCGFSDTAILTAIRNIEPGEELTFDYAMSDCYNMYFECSCEVPSCRGKVTDQDWQIPELQKKYFDYFMPYLKRRIAKLNKDDLVQ